MRANSELRIKVSLGPKVINIRSPELSALSSTFKHVFNQHASAMNDSYHEDSLRVRARAFSLRSRAS